MILDTDDIIKDDVNNKYIPIDDPDIFAHIVDGCIKGTLYGFYVTREGGLVDCQDIYPKIMLKVSKGNPYKFHFQYKGLAFFLTECGRLFANGTDSYDIVGFKILSK